MKQSKAGAAATPYTIVIDTREQQPYSFPNHQHTTTATLPTGDYSILTLESRVAIERKSLPDLFGTVGNPTRRARFRREFERMAEMDFAAIVIESTLRGCRTVPPEYSEVDPRSVIGTLAAWSVRYGVHVWWAENRLYGAATVGKLLGACARRWLGREKQNRE